MTKEMTKGTPVESARHIPVALDRCLDLLAPAISRTGAVVVDATLGLGGHSEAMLMRFPHVTLIGIDRDPAALAKTGERLAAFADRIHLIHAVYDEIDQVVADLGIASVDGVLFDLGVSSMQLDVAERGFSYSHDAPLDMRMNAGDQRTAHDVVNSYSQSQLTYIFATYGEEKFASRIAKAIVDSRAQSEITSTAELAEIIKNAIPAAARRTGGHPAKRTFQAIRIEVNSELAVLERAIPAALSLLNAGGRVVVLSYHSLEDRIVKQAFAQVTTSTVPVDLPFVPAGSEPSYRLLVRGSEAPTDAEIAENPRAASARLRAAERLRAA